MQFDMFAEPAAAAREPDPPPAPKVYAPVEPYEPRPEGGAALEAWERRTQRRNLLDMVRAHNGAREMRNLIGNMAREYLVRLDGMGGAW
ncbi:hypothetical protein [Burkholderia anthina]|uniref:hypothetical protein n=1 Tax=Burkholderia anthina TaxID=179879 RepID=UPI00158AA408|nr:hypothetical protein [Burkholderia anthina]